MLDYLSSKFNSIKTYFSDQDTQQKINIITTVASEGFKVVMATLLAIFIPQECTITENGVTEKRVCTFSDNFSDLTHYNSFVIAFNFITLAAFIGLYVVEIKREDWLIKHLEFNNNYSDNHLTTHKNEYPEIFNRLTHYNKRYAKTYSVLKYIFIINFIFSAILVLHFYYMDYRTVTTLLTNVALCWSKVMTGSSLADNSYKNEMAISYYNTKFVYFNTIDSEYIKKNTNNIEESKINEDSSNNIINQDIKNNVNNDVNDNVNDDVKSEVSSIELKEILKEEIKIVIEDDREEEKIKVIYEDISSNNPSNSDLSSIVSE